MYGNISKLQFYIFPPKVWFSCVLNISYLMNHNHFNWRSCIAVGSCCLCANMCLLMICMAEGIGENGFNLSVVGEPVQSANGAFSQWKDFSRCVVTSELACNESCNQISGIILLTNETVAFFCCVSHSPLILFLKSHILLWIKMNLVFSLIFV